MNNLKSHLQEIGLEIARIDMFLKDTPKIPNEELIKRYKKRNDLQEVAAFINFLDEATETKQKETSSIIQM